MENHPNNMGLDLKKFGKIKSSQHHEGLVIHSAGWPLDNNTYGWKFLLPC